MKPIGGRRCATCKLFKPVDQFRENPKLSFGVNCYCISCDKERNRIRGIRRRADPVLRAKKHACDWAYRKRRLKEDPKFKCISLTRTRIYNFLRRNSIVSSRKNNRSLRTLSLLGCSLDELKTHLESKFKPGMCWENQGRVWHMDHIKPCALFDPTKESELRACFHYTNLQPLFAKENISKSDTFNED